MLESTLERIQETVCSVCGGRGHGPELCGTVRKIEQETQGVPGLESLVRILQEAIEDSNRAKMAGKGP